MIIHRIELHHVKGIEHLVLDDLRERGVTIISGPNEVGKSTIFEALQHALFDKHSSNAKSIKALTPLGTSEPSRIAVEMTLGGQRISIDKTFNYRKSCQLRTPTGTFTGGEAEDVLENLRNEALDEKLRHALFVPQGEVDNTLEALGIPTLQRSLAASGQDSDDADSIDDGGLLAAAQRQLERYYTLSNRRPRKELADAEQAEQQAREEVEELTRQQAQLETKIDEIRAAEDIIDTVTATLPELEEQSHTYAEKAAEADAAQTALDAARTARDTAVQKHTHLTQLVDSRRELIEAAETSAADIAAAQARVDELAEALKEHTTAIEQAERARAEAEDTAAAAKKARRSIDAQRALVAAVIEQDTRAQAWAAVHEASVELDEAIAAQPAQTVSEEDIRAVSDLAERIRTTTAVVEATATRLQLQSETAAQVRIDGEELTIDGSLDRAITAPTTVIIDGVTATITPGSREDHTADTLAQLREELAEALAAWGVENVEQARDLAQATAAAERAVDTAKARLAGMLGGASADDVRRAADKATATLAALRESLPEHAREQLPEIVFAEPPAHDDAEKQSAALKQRAEALDAVEAELEQSSTKAAAEEEHAQQGLEDARALLERLRSHPVLMEHAQASSRLATLSEEHARLSARREDFDAKHPPEQLDKDLEAASAQVTVAQHAVDKAQAAVDEANPQLARSLADGAQEAVLAARARLREAENTVTAHTSHLEFNQGVAEKLARAEDRLTAAQRVCEAVTRRARAAQTVYDVLVRHRDQARARYAAPYTDILNSLMVPVFGPGTSTRMGEQFTIDGREHEGQVLPLQALSGGAQEQMSILQRLAIVQLLGGEDSVPFIIDDPLGNTDATRLKTMAAVMAGAAKHHQVIVLTCAPERFDFVAGKDVRPMRQLLHAQ